ncbi:uncharacterized protein [Engystomops pustulosus]|uniref:uncharacterized protein n=1 Tax=Engystomops pustulosus TaxID=76066 RepID=UPI003AFB3B0F
MESVRTATQLIHTDSYMCTLDLKDAYYHVPIRPSSQRFLRFSVLSPEGSVLHFQFRALPFGISSAPRVFTKIMVEVVAFLRLQDISIIPYLDDLLIIGKDKQNLILARESSLRILTELGWLINLKKSRENIQHKASDPLIQTEGLYTSQAGDEDPGAPHSMPTCGRLESEPYSDPSELDLNFLEQEVFRSRQEDPDSFLRKEGPAVVDGIKEPRERSMLAPPPKHHYSDRCKQLRLGSNPSFPLRARVLDSSPSKKQLKLQGVKSGLGSAKIKHSLSEESSYPHSLGQHLDSVLFKETRRYEIPSIIEAGSYHLPVGRRKHPFHFSHSSEGIPKQRSGLSQQERNPTERMVSQPRDLPTSNQHLGHAPNRPIRHEGEFKMPTILFSGGRRVQGPHGRVQPSLERKSHVCLSPNSPNCESTQENLARRVKGDPDLPRLAKKKLVPTVEVPICPATSYATDSEGPSVPRSDFPSRSRKTPSGGLDPEFEFLRSQGLSRAVITTLKASRKKVTFAIYHKIWKKFVTFCGANPPSQTNPNILQVLDFLQKGLEIGLSTSTLKVQISALSAFFDHPLADHRWVKRFIAAANRIRPQILKRVPSWDLSLVLDALSRPPFEPLKDASIKNLTLKTSLLIAVTSARRLGELQAISIREPYMCILPDRITLTLDPSFVPKVASGFHKNQEIILPSFYGNPSSSKEVAWHSLDFQGKNKGVKASKTTIARWLKTAIASCYTEQGKEVPPNLKAHSTRAISASWAEKRGASLEQICRVATWASSSTFAKHYRLDLPNSQDLAFGQKGPYILTPLLPTKEDFKLIKMPSKLNSQKWGYPFALTATNDGRTAVLRSFQDLIPFCNTWELPVPPIQDWEMGHSVHLLRYQHPNGRQYIMKGEDTDSEDLPETLLFKLQMADPVRSFSGLETVLPDHMA